jgi:hypothetical protein
MTEVVGAEVEVFREGPLDRWSSAIASDGIISM